jgi:hypothetical protein
MPRKNSRRLSRKLALEQLESRRVLALTHEAVHFLQASGYFSMVERFGAEPIPTGVL